MPNKPSTETVTTQMYRVYYSCFVKKIAFKSVFHEVEWLGFAPASSCVSARTQVTLQHKIKFD